MVEPKEHRPRHHRTGGLGRISPRHGLTDTLMWPPGVVVGDVLRENPPELSPAEDDEPIQCLAPHRADEAFDMGVHVGCLNGCTHTGNVVGVVREVSKDRIVVVDEMNGAIDGFTQFDKLLPEKHGGRISCHRMMDDTATTQGYNHQDVEALSEDGIHGEEVHGEQRVDMGAQEGTPGERGADLPAAAEVGKDTADRGLRQIDTELGELALNLADAPHAVLVLQTQNEIPLLSSGAGTTTGVRVGEGPEPFGEDAYPGKSRLGLNDGEHRSGPRAHFCQYGEDDTITLEHSGPFPRKAEGTEQDIAFLHEYGVLCEEVLGVLGMTSEQNADEEQQDGEHSILRGDTRRGPIR